MNEVATCGLHLKAWIDQQVEARLQEVMPSFLDSELRATRQDCMTAVMTVAHVEGEARAVAAAQAKVLAVVECFSEELAKVKEAVAACQAGAQIQFSSMVAANNQSTATREEALMQVNKVRELVEELKRTALGHEQQERDIEAVNTALSQHERLLNLAIERQDISASELRGELKGLTQELQLLRQRQARVLSINEMLTENRRGTMLGLARAVDVEARRELEVLQTELARVAASWTQQLDASGSEKQCSPRKTLPIDTLKEQVESVLWAKLEVSLLEYAKDTRSQLQEFQARVDEDLATLQERWRKDFKTELAAAKTCESASLATPDEQLRVTDQRLSQRIDELVHAQLCDRAAVSRSPWKLCAEEMSSTGR